MVCKTRMAFLQPPLTYVFGIMFILISIMAFFGNAVVLAILRLPGFRSKSHKILASLAISDVLVGSVLSPITAWQVLNSSSLSNCSADAVRRYFTVLLVGSSVLTLAVISYDRYILLTRLTNYHIHMTRNKIIGLLIFAWAFPGSVPLLQFAGKYPYLSMVMLIFAGPLIVLVISYVLITTAVRAKENTLRSYASEKSGDDEPSVSYTSTTNVEHEIKDKSPAAVKYHERSKERNHIRLAKTVAILIMCYFLCLTPLNIWITLDLINASHPFIDKTPHQILYICAMITSQMNSCFNPVIYFLKNSEFKKGFRKLLKIIKKKHRKK